MAMTLVKRACLRRVARFGTSARSPSGVMTSSHAAGIHRVAASPGGTCPSAFPQRIRGLVALGLRAETG
jgi:hypothetical protein